MFVLSNFLLLLVLLMTLGCLVRYLKLRNPKNYPPGPLLPIPILKLLPSSKFFGMNDQEIFESLHRLYGRTFSVNLGYKKIVMICDIDIVKKVFAKTVTLNSAADLINIWRKKSAYFKEEDWKTQRKALLDISKDTGFSFESIENSSNFVWKRLSAVMNEPNRIVTFYDLELPLMEFVLCLSCNPKIFPGGIFPKSLVQFMVDCRSLSVQFIESDIWHRYPILGKLAPGLTGYNKCVKLHNAFVQEIEKIIAMHETDKDQDRDRDFVDNFLDMLKTKNLDPNSMFHGNAGRISLQVALDNLIIGGDGLSIGMHSALYAAARYQHCQEKLRSEIPSPDFDINIEYIRSAMIYNRAFQMEVHLYVCLGTFGGPHQSPYVLEIDGYSIPPFTDIYPNLRHILHDPEHWKDPETFRPERFIDDESNTLVANKNWITFQTGARTCPARNYSMDAMCLLTAKILQAYHITYVNLDGTSPSEEAIIDQELVHYSMSLTMPKPYGLKFKKIC